MPKKKEVKKDFHIETSLTKHILIIQGEMQGMMNEMDKNPMKIASLIGGRVQLIISMFTELHQDKEYKERFFNCIKEMNENNQKNADRKLDPGVEKPAYMG